MLLTAKNRRRGWRFVSKQQSSELSGRDNHRNIKRQLYIVESETDVLSTCVVRWEKTPFKTFKINGLDCD